jgi:tripartite-type tricarboxylate transporter receptor subunit TctC
MKFFSMASLAVALALAGTVSAQDFPSRPITLVVPWPAGGIADQGARVIGKSMSAMLGKPVVIDNKPGAGGILGGSLVANAKPDGYTMFYGSDTAMVSYPFVTKSPLYLPDKAFVPVHGLSVSPFMIAIRSDAPYKTLPQLIDFARKNPGKINYFTLGQGSLLHVLMELLEKEANVTMTQVPYKGGPQGYQDFLGGRIDVMVDYQSGFKPLEANGKAIAIAVASNTRMDGMPHVPTFAELGYKSVVLGPFALLAVPAETPKPVIDKLAAAAAHAHKDPEVVKFLVERGSVALNYGPDETRTFLDKRRVMTKQLLDAVGIKPE